MQHPQQTLYFSSLARKRQISQNKYSFFSFLIQLWTFFLKSTLASFLSQQGEISNIILFLSLAKQNTKLGTHSKNAPSSESQGILKNWSER